MATESFCGPVLRRARGQLGLHPALLVLYTDNLRTGLVLLDNRGHSQGGAVWPGSPRPAEGQDTGHQQAAAQDLPWDVQEHQAQAEVVTQSSSPLLLLC